MMRRGRYSGVLAVLALAVVVMILPAASILAQEGKLDVRINIIEVEAIYDRVVNRVRAVVSVVDVHGKPVKGLTIEDFELAEDGEGMELISVEPAADVMELVLVLDTSGSMSYTDRSGHVPIEEIKKAVLALKDVLEEEDEVALITFSTEVVHALDFTYDHNAVINAANAMKAEGWTCLYDAAYRGVEKAAQRQRGRRALILFTDGFDEGPDDKPCSIRALDEVVQIANTPGINVPIYTVGLESKSVARRELERIALETGGRSVIAPTSGELSDLFVTLAEQLKNQYVLTYESSSSAGPHEMTVKAEDGELFGDSQAKSFRNHKIPPVPKIVLPREGEVVGEPIEVTVETLSQCAMAGTQLYLNDELVSELKVDTRRPKIPLDPADFESGTYAMRVVVFDCNDQPGEDSINVTLQAGAPPPEATGPPATVPAAAETLVPTVPRAEPTPTPTLSLFDRLKEWWPLLLALLIGFLGIMAFLLLRRRQRPAPVPAYAPPVAPPIAVPAPARDDVTMDVGASPIARIIVKESLTLQPGHKWSLLPQDCRIGRSENPEYNNDVVIEDDPISRRHCLIRHVDGYFYASDLGSRFGTTVNGQPVPPDGQRLENGDEIGLGTRTVVVFNYLIPRAEPEPVADLDVTQDVGGRDRVIYKSDDEITMVDDRPDDIDRLHGMGDGAKRDWD